MRLFDPRERRARRGERDRPIHCRLRTPLPRREVGILLRSLFLYLPSPRSLIRRPWATSTHFLRFPRQQQIAVRRRGHGGPRLQDRYLLLLAVREQRHRRLLRRGRSVYLDSDRRVGGILLLVCCLSISHFSIWDVFDSRS